MEFKIIPFESNSLQNTWKRYSDQPDKIFKRKVKYITAFEKALSIFAFYDNQPAAILVSVIYKNNSSELLIIHVKESYRKGGLSKALLKVWEDECRKRRITLMQTIYHSDWDNVNWIEKSLRNLKWNKPEKKFHLLKLDLQKLKQEAQWLQNLADMKSDIKIHKWKELPDYIIKQHLDLSYPIALNPLQIPQKISDYSYGVTYKGNLKGWLITHHAGKAIQYTALYIDKIPQRGLIAARMLKQAGYDQLEDNTTTGGFMVDTSNKEMYRMHLNKFSPYTIYHEYLLKAEKQLLN